MYQHFMYSLKPSTQDVERPQYTSSCSGNQKVLFSNSSRSKNSGSGESAHNDIISEDTSSKPPAEPADVLEHGQQKAVVSGRPPGAQTSSQWTTSKDTGPSVPHSQDLDSAYNVTLLGSRFLPRVPRKEPGPANTSISACEISSRVAS